MSSQQPSPVLPSSTFTPNCNHLHPLSPADHVEILPVRDYSSAIDFYTSKLRFELLLDMPSVGTMGRRRPQRLIFLRAAHLTSTIFILAEADDVDTHAGFNRFMGHTVAVHRRHSVSGLKLLIDRDEFHGEVWRFIAAGVEVLGMPGEEVRFRDCEGYVWTLYAV